MPDPTAKIESMIEFFMSDVSVLACLVLMVSSFLFIVVIVDRAIPKRAIRDWRQSNQNV